MKKITVEQLKREMKGNVIQYQGRVVVDLELKEETEPFVNAEGTLIITYQAYNELQKRADKNS